MITAPDRPAVVWFGSIVTVIDPGPVRVPVGTVAKATSDDAVQPQAEGNAESVKW